MIIITLDIKIAEHTEEKRFDLGTVMYKFEAALTENNEYIPTLYILGRVSAAH